MRQFWRFWKATLCCTAGMAWGRETGYLSPDGWFQSERGMAFVLRGKLQSEMRLLLSVINNTASHDTVMIPGVYGIRRSYQPNC
jgi:hypothetical protein